MAHSEMQKTLKEDFFCPKAKTAHIRCAKERMNIMSEFRKMRRFRQALSRAEAEEILRNGTSGVLACLGDGGYPYAVPVSYFYEDGRICFHMAKTGHKADALAACDKVSFCVIGQDVIVPEEVTTYFKSVIAFGRAKILAGDEKMAAARKLADKYSADFPEAIEKDIRNNFDAMHMVEITVEHLTGKQARELMKKAEDQA